MRFHHLWFTIATLGLAWRFPIVSAATPNTGRPERALAALCMALLCIITAANVAVRYFSNISFAFTEEFSVFLLLVLTLIGAGAASARNTHIRITLFVDQLSPLGQHICQVLVILVELVLFGLLAWLGARAAWDDYQFEVTSPALGIPQWWYSVWLPLLSITLMLRLVVSAWRLWQGGRSA